MNGTSGQAAPQAGWGDHCLMDSTGVLCCFETSFEMNKWSNNTFEKQNYGRCPFNSKDFNLNILSVLV